MAAAFKIHDALVNLFPNGEVALLYIVYNNGDNGRLLPALGTIR